MGINIYRDAQFNYNMDQTRTAHALLREAHMTGTYLNSCITGDVSQPPKGIPAADRALSRAPMSRAVRSLVFSLTGLGEMLAGERRAERKRGVGKERRVGEETTVGERMEMREGGSGNERLRRVK